MATKLRKRDIEMVERAKVDYRQFHAEHLGVVFAVRAVWNYSAAGLVAVQCPDPAHASGECYVLQQQVQGRCSG